MTRASTQFPPRSSNRGPDLQEELRCLRLGLMPVAGLDEAGRGSWAGPVIAACVVLPLDRFDLIHALSAVRDSKTLSAHQRKLAAEQIRKVASDFGLGSASASDVDGLGLLPATRLAMERAIRALRTQPDFLLIDHLQLINLNVPQKAITRGDQSVLSIASASILAKVHRDQIMQELDRKYPGYGFHQHKGYGTPAHRQALDAAGPSPVHRKSYAPIAALLETRAQS